MINSVQLLRNIGLFDSVSAGANIFLARLTLVYAENGRGKTTLAAILRSLATGDPMPIAERRRLAAQHPPHVVLDCTGGPLPAIFQNNSWNRTLSNLVVFDDLFVDQNVYSGLAVEAGNDLPAGFERAVRIAVERRQFWSRFCDVPEIAVDTAVIVRDWRSAREAVTAALTRKQAAPLESMTLARAARDVIAAYEAHR